MDVAVDCAKVAGWTDMRLPKDPAFAGMTVLVRLLLLLLAVGCWLLAVGCWLLAVGCWLLILCDLKFAEHRSRKGGKGAHV